MEEGFIYEDIYAPYQIKYSLLSRCVMHTCISRDFITIKMTLDNYDRLTDSRKHVQNIYNSLELIIQNSYAMCKILSTTFKGSVRT